MDLNCPKCKSESTQKITAIVDSGTTHTHGRSTSVGVASTGRGLGVGTASTTSSSVSKTTLASKLARPIERKKVYPILGTILLGWIPASLLSSMFGSGFFAGLITICAYAGTAYLLFNFLKKKAVEAKTYNTTIYPNLIHEWQNGFFCHRCENVFVPQSF
jgi:hypothetical protein